MRKKKTNMVTNDLHWGPVTPGNLWAALWCGNLPLPRWRKGKPGCKPETSHAFSSDASRTSLEALCSVVLTRD